MTRRTRVALGLGLAVAAVGFVTPAAAQPSATSATSAPRPRGDLSLQVLSFNDFHGHLEPPAGADSMLSPQLDPSRTVVGGAEYLATTLDNLRDEAEAAGSSSRTVAAGDLIGGTPFLSGLFHDEPAVESLEALELDVSSVGNHEFDEGVTELLRMQEGGCHPVDGCYFPDDPYDGADFQWLASNVVDRQSGRTVLPDLWVERIDGVRVGYIGMTLEATPTLVAQAGIQGIDFRDEVRTANRLARELRSRNVDTIIVLLHEGGMQAGTYRDCVGISGPIVEIAEKLRKEIDLVVTGHTHLPYVCNIPDPSGAPRTVTSASSFGRVVTETTLVIDRRTGDVKRDETVSTNHLVARTVPADPEQTAIIQKWKALSAPIGNRVVGTIAADLNPSPNRDTEGALTNVIADAQLAATAAPVDGGAQIAFMNPGGVRASLTFNQISGGEQPGEVTYGEGFVVQPFGNLLVTMDLTGVQIERLLEQQAIEGRPGGRNILILGVSEGFAFTYDGTAPFGSRIDPASITLNGTVIDPAATYRIVTNNFLADGGDAFTVFREGTNRVGGGDDLAALIAYLGEEGPVAPPPDRIAGI